MLREWRRPCGLYWVAFVVLNALSAAHGRAQTGFEEEIIVTAPGGATGATGQRFPGNVQTANADEIKASLTTNLSEFMQQHLASISANDAQGNPFQPELFYRGFGSSSLLGFPQGLSVYVDGVRRNELFGDLVNWDTIPDAAVSRLELIPGSNPIYGLNTLGGSIALQTKSGFSHPGTRARFYGGSFGRYDLQAETGGDTGAHGWYLSAEGFTEDGWRDFSDSDLLQGFARYSYQGRAVQTDMALTWTDSKLRGNGAAPEALLEIEGRESVFTHPDITENSLVQVDLHSVWAASEQSNLVGIAYYRDSETDTFNGDGSDYQACESANYAGFMCLEEDQGEELVFDKDGRPVEESDAVTGGTENSSETSQFAVGGSVQASHDITLAGRSNQLTYGASLDYGDASFQQRTELASLTADRGTDGSGIIDAASFTDVDTDILHTGVFVTNTIAITPRLDLTLSARYNYSDIELRDQLDPDGDTDEGPGTDDLESGETASSLSGKHNFDRLNPGIAFSYEVGPRATLFGYYAESSRAPTPAELTCANPEDPCRLPNAFVDDPPLDQVVTRTVELGARGKLSPHLNWNLAVFNALSEDDILFISDGSTTTEGFFDNVGDTRRRGVELSLGGTAGPVVYSAHYTYIEAEFRDSFMVNSPNHPLREPGNPDEPAAEALQVSTGNQLPGVPQNLLRLNTAWHVNDQITLGATLVSRSDQYFRGDESNTAEELDGFTIVNVSASFRWTDRVEIFGRINNLFDIDYETFGVFGEAEEVLGDDFEEARRFVGPGAPIGAWVGIHLTL